MVDCNSGVVGGLVDSVRASLLGDSFGGMAVVGLISVGLLGSEGTGEGRVSCKGGHQSVVILVIGVGASVA